MVNSEGEIVNTDGQFSIIYKTLLQNPVENLYDIAIDRYSTVVDIINPKLLDQLTYGMIEAGSLICSQAQTDISGNRVIIKYLGSGTNIEDKHELNIEYFDQVMTIDASYPFMVEYSNIQFVKDVVTKL